MTRTQHKDWFEKTYKHLIVLAVLALYILSANSLYVNLILKYGKPYAAGPAINLGAANSGVTYRLTDLQPVQLNAEGFNQVRGYAFETAHPLQKYRISVVLSDGKRNIYFPTLPVDHANMIQSYKGYQSGMDAAEFTFPISKEVLSPGTYKMSLLLEEQGGSNRFLIPTGSLIRKTPNTLTYTPGP